MVIFQQCGIWTVGNYYGAFPLLHLTTAQTCLGNPFFLPCPNDRKQIFSS